MRAVFFTCIVASVLGCSRYDPTEVTSTAQAYVNSWEQPSECNISEEKQVAFFHSHLAETKKPLGEALQSSSYLTRMWAAYVIGQIGPDAQVLDPVIAERLQIEQNRVVRMYLYETLPRIRADTPEIISRLKERFKSLDGTKDDKALPKISWEYCNADEKIHIAALLCILDHGPDRRDYLNYIVYWFRNPGVPQTGYERYYLWERRKEAMPLLNEIPGAKEAIPLLDKLQEETDAPGWVHFELPSVIESLK